MTHKTKTYGFLVGVFFVSLGISLALPINEIFKGIASTPAIAALFAVIYQLLRDNAAHEKQQLLQQQ